MEDKMKRLLVILLAILLIGCLEERPQIIAEVEYTYDSEIDPIVFMEWEMADKQFIPPSIIFITMINPDKEAEIKEVVTMHVTDGDGLILMGYSYLKGDEEFIFVLDWENNHYYRYVEQPEYQRL